jgi:hypothetical protein
VTNLNQKCRVVAEALLKKFSITYEDAEGQCQVATSDDVKELLVDEFDSLGE